MATAIGKLNAARRLLTEAKSLNDVLGVCDMASAIRAYAKAAGESLEVQNAASDLRLSAERKAGELLAAMEKNEGGRPSKTNDIKSSVSLADIGVTPKQSSRWQLAAKLPADDYAAIVSQCNASGKELTQAAVLRAARAFVFGECDPDGHAEPEPSFSKANLLDLISMARAAISDLADAFGSKHIETLIGVLKDEIQSLEDSLSGKN